MDQVLVVTADLVGMDSPPSEEREAPLTCERRDGRRGVSYPGGTVVTGETTCALRDGAPAH
jgi:hypothetical protein